MIKASTPDMRHLTLLTLDMPTLDQIRYSRQTCIDAVRDYYKFLIKLHLPPQYLDEPPEGGWPHMTPSNARMLGKTDEVIELLRHLPYWDLNRAPVGGGQGAPYTNFAEWPEMLRRSMREPREEGEIDEELRLLSEGTLFQEVDVPAHIIGLTAGGSTAERFLLDTELGVIYWLECRDEVKSDTPRDAYPEGVLDNAWDYAESEEEASWRDCGAWAVPDFFEMLKDQFRRLNFYPTGSGEVDDVWISGVPERYREGVRQTFRDYGWSDMARYRKKECLEAVRAVVLAEQGY